jgi:hypothetical protein
MQWVRVRSKHDHPTEHAVVAIAKMARQVQKASCVVSFHESKLATVFQRQFKNKFGMNTSSRPSEPLSDRKTLKVVIDVQFISYSTRYSQLSACQTGETHTYFFSSDISSKPGVMVMQLRLGLLELDSGIFSTPNVMIICHNFLLR